MGFSEKRAEVVLSQVIREPYNLAIATARTCYSSQGIITVSDVVKDENARALRDRIAQSTMEAGHLTTRQHAHFVFSLNNVSRSFIWSFLHSHPFYNSEQVSQRYVRVKTDNFYFPQLSEKHRKLYEETLQLQMESYNRLIDLVRPTAEKEYYRIFPHRLKNKEKWDKVILKKSYEVARYVLPIATFAYLYHTVSALTLLRYYKLMNMFDTPQEQKSVIYNMVEAVKKEDPDFEKEIQDPYRLEDTPEFQILNEFQFSHRPTDFIHEFDESLRGMWSKLIDYKVNAEQTLAQSVRSVFGLTQQQLSNEDAIEKVLNPAHNKYLSDTLNPNMHTKLSRTLSHVHFTFRKKMSHTADSQEQRHRMTPASRPILLTHFSGNPDFITPKIISETPAALELFNKTMQQTWNNINKLLNDGVSFEKAHYLLPNAWAVRYEESGDLLGFHHKWKLRTCYNAQEEIFYSSIDELKQVNEKFPLIGKHILAPCYLRKLAEVKPYCPEGDRYCGIPVWKRGLNEYKRLI